MKDNKFISGCLAWVYALVIGVAGVGCLLSGFRLELENGQELLLFCAFFSLVCVLCFTRKWGSIALLALSVALVWADFEALSDSVALLLYRITKLYDSGYGWGYIPFTGISSRTQVDGAAMLLAGIIIAAVSWTLCRGRWCGFAVIAGLLPLLLCCVLVDTVPDDPWLLALVAALLMLILTHRLRRASPRQANRITALILIPVVLCTSLLFTYSQGKDFYPTANSLQQRLLELAERFIDLDIGSRPSVPSPGVDQTVSHVDLANTGPLNLADYVPLYVMAPSTGILYLRGQAYDRYTGNGWYATAGSKGNNGWPTSYVTAKAVVRITTKSKLDIRFFPYYVGEEGWTDELTGGAYPNPDGEKIYSFPLAVFRGNAAPSELTAQEYDTYTALPNSAADVSHILDALFADDEVLSDREIADRIADYVRSSAVYDQNTPTMDNDAEDFALWFLESSDTGYCVHFATAAAVLLRAAGIPARYVTGYLTYSIAGVQCPVNNTQSHAWVEYLDPDLGWTVLEATPGAENVEPPEVSTPTETTLPPDTTAPTETTLPQDTTDPTETTLPQDTADPTETTLPEDTTQTTQPPGPGAVRVNLRWARCILYVLLAWAILGGQYRLRRKMRQKRFAKGSGSSRGLTRWRYARFLARVTGLSRPVELLELADKAAFSQHELTESEIAQFDAWIHAAQEKLLNKPRPVKWLLRLIFAI